MRIVKACALSLTLIPTLSFGASENVNCKDFAIEQLKEIKKEYYGALTRDESTLALEVAERSCRALFETVEEERAAIQSTQQYKSEKQHWWEEDHKAKPNIKKAHQSGGK